jgi:hypothetical protein
MNEESSSLGHEERINIAEIKKLKRQSFLVKVLIITIICFFSYFGLKYFQIKEELRRSAKNDVGKYNDIQNEIFDLSEEYKTDSSEQDPNGLSDLSGNEIHEKDSDFVFRSLLKNQLQINDLKAQVQILSDEFLKYKNREKIVKIIFSYVELRQKIFSENENKNYKESLKNFEMLTSLDDPKLQEFTTKLIVLLENFSSKKELIENFNQIIPHLIVTNKIGKDDSLIAKIRYNIAKLIVIRRIDGENAGEIDASIVKIEKFLRQENYQEALNILLALDPIYHNILADFLSSLNNALEIQKIDQEILSYLKTLG